MFTTIADLLAVGRAESHSTTRVLDALTDDSLSYRAHERSRTAGEMAWHIVTSVREIAKHTGLEIDGPTNETPMPPTVEDISAAYRRAVDSLYAAVEGSWFDGTLVVEDEVYGEQWPRGKTLFVLLCHEIHHRGQLTLLLRQAGLKVPGVYGPSGDGV